jgi:Tfp pilus assembly protein FimT
MKKQHLRNPSSNSKGITLIEILLGLAVLVILLSFAVPSVSGAEIRAEMSAAQENVQYSIQAARQTARMNEAAVAMNISAGTEQSPLQTISFSSASKKKVDSVQIQDFTMSPEIMVISDRESYVFDERGLVKDPGTILLMSTVDESITSSIPVN